MSKKRSDERQRSRAHEPDAIGYCRPPMQRRFKDASGNSKGRPKGSKNHKTIVKEIANEMHVVNEKGKRTRRSTLDLVLLSLRNSALEGKTVRTIEEFCRLIERYQPQETNGNVGYMIAPAEMTPEEWIAKQEETNKTRKPPPEYEGSCLE